MALVADVANVTFENVARQRPGAGRAQPPDRLLQRQPPDVPYWGVAKDFVTASNLPPYGQMFGVNSAVNLGRANAQGGWTIGESNPRKLMHELLHTLGLDHPGPYNGDSADYESQALFYQDSQQYTVMSYWLAGVTGADHEADGRSYFASTPLLYDVAALQHLYGANMTTRTGDTVYGFHANAGREVYDLEAHPQAVFTIWDAGGWDRLDLSGYATPSSIDLHGGAFTDAGGLTDNISIAHGARIEKRVGGAGNDVIIVNSAANPSPAGRAPTSSSSRRRWTRRPRRCGRTAGRRCRTRIGDFASGSDRIDLSAIDAVPARRPTTPSPISARPPSAMPASYARWGWRRSGSRATPTATASPTLSS